MCGTVGSGLVAEGVRSAGVTGPSTPDRTEQHTTAGPTQTHDQRQGGHRGG